MDGWKDVSALPEQTRGEYLCAAERLHRFLCESYWDGESLIGPDQGVGFNRRFWRFAKSYLSFIPWDDSHRYLQAQGYWVLSNWDLYDLIGEDRFAGIAINCAQGIRRSQRPLGHWDYPHPGWAGRIATVEVAWGALGMLASYERTKSKELLEGVCRAYEFLVEHTGFQKAGAGYALNYFSGKPSAVVPNNTTLGLAFFGRLSHVLGDGRYLSHCGGMIAFLTSAQLESGELPYALDGPLGKGRPHFQCYQYNAFELQDLAMYYNATGDERALPLIVRVAHFLAEGVRADGSTRVDCNDRSSEVVYHIGAVAAALGIARRMCLFDASDVEERAYSYVLNHERTAGGFGFSRREHCILRDGRCYPRPTVMILYHLLLRAAENRPETRNREGARR
jgi:hypothetical protein